MNVESVPKTEPRPSRTGGESANPAHSADLAAPIWASQWAGARPRVEAVGDFSLAVSEGEAASLVSVRLAGARRLGATEFERRTVEAYQLIHSTVAALRHGCPVRFWNFLPGIHQMMEPPRDRYMVFNAGRFAALSDWFGGPGRLPGSLPAASAVGHDGGDDFAVHCLLLSRPGVAVENPRQVPAFRYSARYGPKPPCFARATVVPDPRDGAATLLAAGTASILGEQSVHHGDLPAQFAETLTNLRALVRAATGTGAPHPQQGGAGGATGFGAAATSSAQDGEDGKVASTELSAFTAIRVYHIRPQDAAEINSAVRAAFPVARVETIRAELCRADLLVEIEGVTRLAAAQDTRVAQNLHEKGG